MIRAMILDSQEAEFETGVPRRLEIQTVPGKASVCIGVRRCGKSTYMMQIMQRLVGEGISRQNMLHLNFFDDRLYRLPQEGLGVILEAYFSLFPEKKHSEKVYFFLDEIQTVLGWEKFIDRLLRTEKCEVYITGSSAHMLSREVATQMRGRSLSWEMFPFSFREYLNYLRIDNQGQLSTKKRLLIQKGFESFWEAGGFPEVTGLSKALRVKTHQEYFQAILFRDLIERYDIAHPKAVSDLTHRLVDNTASLYSINNLTGYLQALGHRVPKSAVSEYLKWFEDAYFLFTVKLFDASAARANTNPKKIYCIDHSLVTSVSSGILQNSGHLLENLVFTALRRMGPDIHYYRTKCGREVDFIISLPEKPLLVQVCESIADPRTKKRETAALTVAMSELDLNSGIIVTRHEQDEIKTSKGTITVMPVWSFLLDLDTVAKE